MNVQPMRVTQQQAWEALKAYRSRRAVWDKVDCEISRIHRRIAKGDTVISVHDAIRGAGLDGRGRPKLAIMRADQAACLCETYHSDKIVLTNGTRSKAADRHFEIPWPDRPHVPGSWDHRALLPRIPPQHRPEKGALADYHILWEADWTDIPRDPYLLKRIGKDAWVVLAAWELSSVEVAVLRSHQ